MYPPTHEIDILTEEYALKQELWELLAVVNTFDMLSEELTAFNAVYKAAEAEMVEAWHRLEAAKKDPVAHFEGPWRPH